MRNKPSISRIAKENMPFVPTVVEAGWCRHDVVRALKGSLNIGIELGVAKGIFAKRMIDSGVFSRFYGVDMYQTSQHDTNEYALTLKYVGFQNPAYSLLRMDFDSALGLFDDEYFDFIYVDGFAHTGEEGGKTLADWFPKLKVGGIIAGDDYHDDWPLVIWAVNHLASQVGTSLHVTGKREETAYSRYPTWFLKKPSKVGPISLDPMLYELGMKEKARLERHGGHLSRALKMGRSAIGKVKRLIYP